MVMHKRQRTHRKLGSLLNSNSSSAAYELPRSQWRSSSSPPSLLCLSLSFFLLFSHPARADVAALPGTIERTAKQMILAAVPQLPPDAQDKAVPFLTSPSGKYTAYLVRTGTAPGAGGFGNDFCFIQVQDTSSGESMWESECGPVSTANTCSLAFTTNGLEVYDGSKQVWDTGAQSADNGFLERVELVDQGDMRIRDKNGELAWKVTDDPHANQGCGLPGSPGLAAALPPFSGPIGGDSGNLVFGQPAQSGEHQHPIGAYNQQQQQEHPGNGLSSQPLVDNSPYDSGCTRATMHRIGFAAAAAAFLLALHSY